MLTGHRSRIYLSGCCAFDIDVDSPGKRETAQQALPAQARQSTKVRYVAAADEHTKQVCIWDVAHSQAPIQRLQAHTDHIRDIRYCSEGLLLGSLSKDWLILHAPISPP